MPDAATDRRPPYQNIRELIATGRKTNPSIFRDAGTYWDEHYSDAALRDRRARELKEHRAFCLANIGSTRTEIGLKHGKGIKYPKHMEPWMRLSFATDDLRTANLDFSVLKRPDRIAWAARVLVLAWVTTDPDAADSGLNLTEFERTEWCVVKHIELTAPPPNVPDHWEPAVDTGLVTSAIDVLKEELELVGGNEGADDNLPMTDGQKAVWDALHGSCKSAKELASDANTSAVTVRQHILDLRKAGRKILHRQGRGYWRQDAPPAT